MKCEDVVRLLSEYLDQELDAELSSELRQHVRSCQNCQVVLDSTEKTILLYKGMEKRTISLARKAELFEHIQKAFDRPLPGDSREHPENSAPD